MMVTIHRFIIICIVLVATFTAYAQVDPNGYNVFYHENDTISSEGFMRDGKPDGYWKTFNEQGILISEGNRKDFELDSSWLFYDDVGRLKLEINYKQGKKNGIRRTYREDEIVEENFENDIKEGSTNYYYKDGKLKKTIMFVNGLEEGLTKEFGEDGRIITLITYKSGYIVDRLKINRYDTEERKNGAWKYFYDNGVLKMEGSYKRGLENGYFKEYDRDGNLLSTAKYVDGVKQEDVQELVKLEVRKDYYPDGKVKIAATYNKQGEPEGIRREYAPDGTIRNSYIFKNGIMIGEGIVTEKGERDGLWKEYFDDGNLKAEGNYNKDVKTGKWKFFHRNGQLWQEGAYSEKGRPDGEWRWYYESGALLREEYYYLGKLDGEMTEYDEDENIITRGNYIEGYEDGEWNYRVGDSRVVGNYIEGMRNGQWEYYYVPPGFGRAEVKVFEGRYVEDNPNGKHTYYWNNGKRRDEGNYVMGRKNGDWVSYNFDGTPFLVINYNNGKELKYDGMKIDLSIQNE